MQNDHDCEQGDDKGVETAYGLVNEEPLCQELGGINTFKLILKNIERYEIVVCIFRFSLVYQ